MVEDNALGTVAGQLTEKVFSGILWFGVAAIGVCLVGGFMWYFLIYKRKFNIDVKITSKRAKDKNNILFDRAAILTDRKSKTKYFRLWSTRVDLPVPHFNILQKTEKGDYIEIYRTGEDSFYYLMPPKINKRYIIRGNDQVIPIAEQVSNLIDPELQYWSVKRKGLNKSMFDTEKLWMKVLPYIPHIIAGVITIFILYILMSYLPNILAALQQLVKELNQQRTAEIVTAPVQIVRGLL